MNTTKTIVLMVVLTVLLVFVGGALGGRQGMIMAFIFASVMNLVSYWFSDKIVLRMYKAREVTEAEAPVLYGITRDLAMRLLLLYRSIDRELKNHNALLTNDAFQLMFETLASFT